MTYSINQIAIIILNLFQDPVPRDFNGSASVWIPNQVWDDGIIVNCPVERR